MTPNHRPILHEYNRAEIAGRRRALRRLVGWSAIGTPAGRCRRGIARGGERERSRESSPGMGRFARST